MKDQDGNDNPNATWTQLLVVLAAVVWMVVMAAIAVFGSGGPGR